MLTPIFGRVMSHNRFQHILSCLHFFDRLDPGNVNNHKIRRIRYVFDHCRQAFAELFHPYRDLVINESQVL